MDCILLLTIIIISSVSSLDLRECNRPLGMENGMIATNQISASSAHDDESTGPQHSRLNAATGSGAWCPESQINPKSREWLQVAFPYEVVVTGLETQGRFDKGEGKEFAQFYRVEYWRSSIGHWQRLRAHDGKEVFVGNTDTRSREMVVIGGGIVAEKVRIYPVSNSTRTVCMRVEFHGCIYKGLLQSYSAPEGAVADGLNLKDFRFDGRRSKHGILREGLGKLYDGELGHDNHESKPEGWIGWRREEDSSPDTLTLNFNFGEQRNISGIRFHTSNYQKYNAKPFTSALVELSTNGKDYSVRTVRYDYSPDSYDNLRWVRIAISDRLTRSVKVHLTIPPSPYWLLLSEVHFESGRAGFEMSAEIPEQIEITSGNFPGVVDSAPETAPFGFGYVVLGAVALLLTFTLCFLCCCGRRGQRIKSSPSPMSFPTKAVYQVMLEGGTIKHVSPSTYEMAKDNLQNDRLEKMPLNELAECSEYADPDVAGFSCSDDFSSTPLLSKRSFIPGAFSTLRKTSTHPLPPPPIHNSLLMTSSTLPYPSSHYAISEPSPMRLKKASEESPLSSKHRFAIYDQLYSTTLPEICRDKLQILEKIGQGEFGEVHLCRLEKRRVAVKMLTKRTSKSTCSDDSPSGSPDSGIDDEAEMNFEREMRVLGALKHPNVVEVIGVCTTDRPFACVMEYMENGDVKKYLQRNPDIDSATALAMCTQIAAGMSYLESQDFVHRDLAARNCLLDGEFTVKIGDFGMARSLYSEEYYRVEGRAGRLPVRWMSWECMLMGKFSTASDVWSFGVTAWEVLSRAEKIPHYELSHEEVVANIHHMHATGKLHHFLPCPPLCPIGVYKQLLIPCWSRDPNDRPSFKAIHHYLQTLQHTSRLM